MRSQRINEIEQYVTRNKTVTLDDLCQTFGVSKNTIRRDVEELVDRGALKKIYGGVTAPTTRELLPFEERRGRTPRARSPRPRRSAFRTATSFSSIPAPPPAASSNFCGTSMM